MKTTINHLGVSFDTSGLVNCSICDSWMLPENAILCEDEYYCKDNNCECLAESYSLNNEVLKVISENYKKEE